MSEWLQLIITGLLSGGLVGGGVGVYMARANRRQTDAVTDKTDAEAVQVISATSVALLVPLREQLGAAQAEVKALRGEVNEARAETREARDEARQAREEAHDAREQLRCEVARFEEYRALYGPNRST